MKGPLFPRLSVPLLLTSLLLTPVPTPANDGFGGLTATGLQFSQTAAVQMVSEDLFLSPDQVRVRSLFRNDSDAEVRGEVIFPLPPIALAGLQESAFALAEDKLRRQNMVDFVALVDGHRIAVNIERMAVVEPPYEENRRPSAAYDAPGEEVTALLKNLGIPLSLEIDQVTQALTRLPPSAQERLKARGLATFHGTEPPTPAWSIIERYHWTQTFARGKEVTIEHRYHPAPPGGIFVWPAQGTEPDPYQRQLIATYCIDAPSQRAIGRLLHPPTRSEYPGTGSAVLLDYVLTTANTWKGPINRFHLTIDKGRAGNVLSLCVDGIRKTGPTTFEVEKTNFRPERDLRLLIVSPLDH